MLPFPDSVYEAGGHGVFDDGFDPLVWPFALLLVSLLRRQVNWRGVGVFPGIFVEELPRLPSL